MFVTLDNVAKKEVVNFEVRKLPPTVAVGELKLLLSATGDELKLLLSATADELKLLLSATVAELKLLPTATVGDKMFVIRSVRPFLPMPSRRVSAGYLCGH